MSTRQKTIKQDVLLEGVGLHSGQKVKVTLRPAAENQGVVFVRKDLPGAPSVKADFAHILREDAMPRCTSLSNGQALVHTVEHLMAALYGLEIDNLVVEINGEEMPGLDGSGKDFYDALKRSGIREQDAEREFVDIKEPIWIEEGGASLFAVPAPHLMVSYTLDYQHPVLAAQFFSEKIDTKTFEEKIMPSRTFCLESEAKALKDKGLGKGATYKNTLVVTDTGVKDNTVRFPDEFARHKVLDFIGDLYLLGKPVRAHVIGIKSGHSLNRKLVQKIAEQEERYRSRFEPQGHQFSQAKALNIEEIQKILPHRYPFLLVDRVIELVPGVKIVAIKNVTANEPQFQGHFPQKPVMPGVLMVEAMAQVGGIAVLTSPENKGKLALFMSIDNVKFRRVVSPGDQLVFEVEVVRCKSRVAQIKGTAKVEDKLAVEAEMSFSFTDVSYLYS